MGNSVVSIDRAHCATAENQSGVPPVKHLQSTVYKCEQVLSDRCGSCHILSYLHHPPCYSPYPQLYHPLGSHHHSSGQNPTNHQASKGLTAARHRTLRIGGTPRPQPKATAAKAAAVEPRRCGVAGAGSAWQVRVLNASTF